jgi:gamma-polyglutamate biosynthesis protein CapA
MSDKSRKAIFTILLVLLITQVGLIYMYLKKENSSLLTAIQKSLNLRTVDEYANLTTHRSYHMKLDVYDSAYKHAATQTPITADKIHGGIIPHHLMVKDKIAAYFSGLKNEYETVILIGPNHYQVGEDNILLSKAKWNTPYGELLPDLEISNQFSNYLTVNEDPFGGEHSISGLVPFVKNSLPKAKIVPIIIKYQTPLEELDGLISLLDTVDKEKTLVLASVDFSHFQGSLVSEFHDQQSIGVINSFDTDRLHNLEVDSPASLYVVLNYLENISAQSGQLAFHTISSDLINQPDEPGTSHQLWYFSPGTPSQENIISFLFFGDLMLDRNVGTKIEEYGLDYLFANLATDENRFFMGPDIVAANLEGAVTNNGQHYLPTVPYDFAFDPVLIKKLNQDYFFNYFTLANNHVTDQGRTGLAETYQNLADLKIPFSGCPDAEIEENCVYRSLKIADQKIAIVGLSMVYHMFDTEQAIDIISNLNTEHDLVIVNIHWGVEYEHQFNPLQQTLAHQFIDAGADMIIGHHPHVVQGMEIYQNKPIFYSLGNFIFDQYFSPDTQEELAVGINYNTTSQDYTLYLMPMTSQASQPQLMVSETKQNFLQKYFNWSEVEDSYQDQILSSKIEL